VTSFPSIAARELAILLIPGWNFLIPLFILVVAQQIWIFVSARRSANREELFKIITENAADMIALVNVKGRRLYNSPSYQKVLGYTAAELAHSRVRANSSRRSRQGPRSLPPGAVRLCNTASATRTAPGGSSNPQPAPSATPRDKPRSSSSSIATSPREKPPKKNSPMMLSTTPLPDSPIDASSSSACSAVSRNPDTMPLLATPLSSSTSITSRIGTPISAPPPTAF
jgi:hypothetical protein